MTARVDLPEKLDTASVPELVQVLRRHQGASLALDASRVTQFGALAVQTLIVAANDWQDSGHALSLENVDDEVRAQLRLLGTSPEVLTEGDYR